MKEHLAYISVGSNLGDKLINCQKGIATLTSGEKVNLIEVSKFYITQPVDFKEQEWFVNAVIKVTTSFDPFKLLAEMLSIQQRAGRHYDKIRFGPRILDLDILFYDNLVIKESNLVLPHPRMHKRRFVLKPICDIDKNLKHPVLKKNMQVLLDSLQDNEQKVLECSCEP